MALAAAVPAARADAIPPPENLSDTQHFLIGIWREDHCVMPMGLGHACVQRVLVFGNDQLSETSFADMSMSNQWGTMSRSGSWTAEAVSKTTKVTAQFQNGNKVDLAIEADGQDGFNLVSMSDEAMYPASHFTRVGMQVQPAKN